MTFNISTRSIFYVAECMFACMRSCYDKMRRVIGRSKIEKGNLSIYITERIIKKSSRLYLYYRNLAFAIRTCLNIHFLQFIISSKRNVIELSIGIDIRKVVLLTSIDATKKTRVYNWKSDISIYI